MWIRIKSNLLGPLRLLYHFSCVGYEHHWTFSVLCIIFCHTSCFTVAANLEQKMYMTVAIIEQKYLQQISETLWIHGKTFTLIRGRHHLLSETFWLHCPLFQITKSIWRLTFWPALNPHIISVLMKSHLCLIIPYCVFGFNMKCFDR